MSHLKIQTTPENWNNSTITAIEVIRSGRPINKKYTSVVAQDLPEEWRLVWTGAVEQFQSMGGGNWDAEEMTVRKIERESGPVLRCDFEVTYPDYTTALMNVSLDSYEMINFFNYLTNESTWQDPTKTNQPEV